MLPVHLFSRPRTLLAVLPAALIASVALSTIWGQHGLVARTHVERELQDTNARLAAVDQANQRLLWELDRLSHDPRSSERVAAEELSWGRKGTILYRFEPVGEASPRP